MKNNRIIIPGVILCMILVFTGCQFEQTYTGSLTLVVPDYSGGPLHSVSRGDTTDYSVRIYLMRNGSPQVFTGSDLNGKLEKVVTSGNRTIIIDDLLAAKGYAIYLAYGKGAGENFIPDYFGESEPFVVSADGVTTVTINTFWAPARIATGERASFAILSGKLYALANNKLSEYDGKTLVNEISLPGDYVGNSLSIGKAFDAGTNRDAEEIWINTSKRIVPYRNSSFKLDFGPAVEKGVTDSGAVMVKGSSDGESFRWAFYQNPGNIGTGYFPEKTSEKPTWTDVQAELNKNLGSNASGSEQIIDAIKNMKAMFLLDYFMGDSYAYIVPAPALLISPIMVGTSMVDDFNKLTDKENISFSWIKTYVLDKGQIKMPAGSGSITAVSKAADRLYIGTNQGIYWMPVNAADGTLSVEATFIANTGKYNVRKISAYKSGNSYIVAAVMNAEVPERNTLVVLKDNAIAREYKFFSGVPKNMKQVSIFSDGTNVKITASGDNGVILVPAP